MDKYLITGFSGFVSKHFLDYLENNKIQAHIMGIDMSDPFFDIDLYNNLNIKFVKTNLLNFNEIDNVLYQFKPDYILHLASYSSVGYSWKEPVNSFVNNTNIFLNIVDKIRIQGLKCRILSVGSSEEYGNISENDLPLKEDMKLNPCNPYAVARVSQEMLSKIYVDGYDLDILMTRSFNHIGPYQKDIFVIPSFIKQLVMMKKNNTRNTELVTGDITIIRDFVDVRDVVAAYYKLFKKGKKGEIYNVCSGIGISLEEIIRKIEKLLNIEINIKINKNLIRPNDNKVIIGCNDKIKKEIGWDITISLENCLKTTIEYWNNQ